MKLSHKDFTVVTFDYEKYTHLLRSEGAGGKLNVQMEYKNQPLGGVSTKQPIALVGIQWYFYILHNSRRVFSYVASDNYYAILDGINDDANLNQMIGESWDRYSKKFDDRRHLVGIDFPLDELDDVHIELVRESIKLHLKL